MSATGYLDSCGFNPASSGTGDFVVSAAITGYQTPAGAGAVNGTVYSYRAQSSDLSQWEDGFGAYTVSTTTLARTTVTASSTGSKVSFTAPPNVYITALSADLQNASLLASGTVPTALLGSGTANSGSFLRGDSTWAAVVATTVSLYTSSQTITIPAGATKAYVILVGGGSGGSASGGPGGGGGALYKLLTGLTPGNTLSLTVGAGGASSGSGQSGGASSLSSGSQTISTLTANGGLNGLNYGAGGSASGGDMNFPGEPGFSVTAPMTYYIGGASGIGTRSGGVTQSASVAGFQGFCQIVWFA